MAEIRYANIVVCEFCFGSGWTSIDYQGFSEPLKTDNRYRGVKKCFICNYWAERMVKANIKPKEDLTNTADMF